MAQEKTTSTYFKMVEYQLKKETLRINTIVFRGLGGGLLYYIIRYV